MESGIKCTLSKFVKTQLSDVMGMLEGKNAMHGDLDRLERWACVNFKKFNEVKSKVPCLRWDNPKHKYSLG